MKNASFTILIFLCFATICSSQFSLTPSVGLNVSKAVYTDDIIISEPISSYFVELRPSYRIDDNWHLNLGVQYSNKGFRFDSRINNLARRVELAYLDILPSAEYTFSRYLSAYAGLNVGFLMTEKITPFISLPSLVNNRDMGALLGVRGHYQNWVVSAHFNRSIWTVSEFLKTDINGKDDGSFNQFNQNIQVGIGYLIDFKKEIKER